MVFEAPQWRIPKLIEPTLFNKRDVKSKSIADNNSKYPNKIDSQFEGFTRSLY